MNLFKGLESRYLLPGLAVSALALALTSLGEHFTYAGLGLAVGALATLPLATRLRRHSAGAMAHACKLQTELDDLSKALAASERRMSLFMEQAADGIWEWQPARDEWYFSPMFRSLLGYADEAAFQREFRFWQAIHPEDQERALARRDDCLAGRLPAIDEDFRLKGRDGYHWFRCRAGLLVHNGDTPRGMAGFIADIGRRKELEDELDASRERQATAIQALSEGIWNWDLKDGVSQCSPRLRDMLGYPEAELPTGRDGYLRLVHPDDRTRVEGEWRRHFEERLPYDSEHRLRLADGSYHWFRTRGQTSWDNEGQPTRFSAALSDITLHRRALDSIRALLAENQALLDNTLVGIVQTRSHLIFGCNRRFEEISGYDFSMLVDKPIDLVFPSATDADRLRRHAFPALSRGERFSIEAELRRKDGGSVWCLVSGQSTVPDRPEDGCVWAFADLGKQKHAMDALRHERDFSNALISHLPGLFCLLDKQGRIIRWNANFEYQTDFSAREILEMTWNRLFADGAQATATSLIQTAWKDGSASGQIPLKSKAGNGFPCLFTCVRVEVDNEPNLALLGLDVTEREAVAQRIRELNEDLERRVQARTSELESLNRELESFSYSVSHDLSTPLRSIEGFARILEQDYSEQLDDPGRNFLHRIRAAAGRMHQLIEDLLALSRINRDALQLEECDLADMARQIFSELHYQDPERTVTESVADHMPVVGDRNLLMIVMENLVRNAWKFTSRHSQARIEVGVMDKNGEAVYFVRDDGAGFDMQYASKLFGAFQRLHHLLDFEGTGIGLALVARIVHRHGGRIWAEAAVEKGATFYLTLTTTQENAR